MDLSSCRERDIERVCLLLLRYARRKGKGKVEGGKGENTIKNAAALEFRSTSKSFGRRRSLYGVHVMGSTSDVMGAIWGWAGLGNQRHLDSRLWAPLFGSGDGAKWGPQPTIVIHDSNGRLAMEIDPNPHFRPNRSACHGY